MEQNLEKKTKKGQLRDTFILLFILISCIPILILGTVSLLNISTSHKKNVSELERQTLVSTTELTTSFFTSIFETLSTNFDTLSEEKLTTETVSWQDMYAKKFAESNQAILEVSFVDPSGKESAKFSKINKDASVMLHYEELPLFKEAKKGSIVMSSVHNTLHGQTVTVASPLILNGKVFQVVIAEVSLLPLITSLEKVTIGSKGYVLLFDTEGTHVGSKHASTKGRTNFSSWVRFKNILSGENENGQREEDRYMSLFSQSSVTGSGVRIPDISWVLMVEWPTVESDILVEDFRNTVLITMTISIIIVFLLALFVAQKLVLPIKRLMEATQDIEKGIFDKEVSITTDNELEELGESFNTMALGLKRLEELKNEFVYVAAHELRAPVTAIKGYLELVFDGGGGPVSKEMEHLLLPVKRSNDRLVALVNDLLKVAKSEAGKLEIAVSPVSIVDEVSAILDEIRPLAMQRNMTISYNTNASIPLVLVNAGSFKEIVMNFASNAVKYGNDNGTITVTHEIQDRVVSTSIADNGRGMSEEDQKHLFQKFFRANDVKKTSIEGTGLGLFITKELVEKMGGTLSVKSQLGVGTTFTVTFPIAQEIPSQNS